MMTLEAIITEYRTLADRAVAYHKLHCPEVRGWLCVSGLIHDPLGISSYISEESGETAAKIGQVMVSNYSSEIKMPYTYEGIQQMRHDLPTLRKRLAKAIDEAEAR